MSERAFTIGEAVAADAQATVYRARRSDGRPFWLKVLEKRPTEPRELEHLRNELSVARTLDRSKVLRPLSLTTLEGLPALVREDFAGVPLERVLAKGPLKVALFLDLAINIVAALEHVHRAQLVHRDLNPRSILVKPGTHEVRLSEFGLTSHTPRESSITPQPDLIEGTLAYMSPEQTGRTNRSVDSRSDLYSLGVVFFVMLTGELPFQARDSLGWIHAHVARPPPPPDSLVKDVPPVLSSVILRLLAKMPEDRYQSAHGLRLDLEQIRAGLDPGKPFVMGEHDVSEQLRLSQHLYGREEELGRLRALLREVSEKGRSGLALISGQAGVGKSALARELLSSISNASGRCLPGKFDIQQRSVPYSTIIRGFRRTLRALLGESEEQLAAWRARLGEALGQNGRLITDVIPEAELILGPQPPLVPLPPLESERRFLLVLHDFISVFAAADHPLVLFLDDLQWADPASLRLVQELLTEPETRHVFVIGGFRDNEVGPSHELYRTVSRLREAGVPIEEIVLGSLGPEHVVALTADSLRRPVSEVRPLAQLIHEKTGGNPFFVKQLLGVLHRDGLLVFDLGEWRWRWDLERIRDYGYTENVVDFMVRRIERLPRETRELVKLASCVGSTVAPKMLAMLAGVEVSALEGLLSPALEEHLLFSGAEGYRFTHDRVQQAAYSPLSEEERVATHLRIGRISYQTTPSEELDEHVFEIVNQLNRGHALITDPEERMLVARLNLSAGRKARNAAAPLAATQYLSVAIELFGNEGWARAYELVSSTYLIQAECAFLLGNPSEAFGLLDTIEEHARSVLDRAPGRNLRAWILTNQGRLIEATEYCIETARLQGCEFPSPHDGEAIQRAADEAFEAYQSVLAGRTVESLADLPPITGPNELATLDTFYRAVPGAYQWNPELMTLLILKAVLLGAPLHRAPAFFYAQYGIVHAHRTGDLETAFRFGELAVRLSGRAEDRVHTGATYFIHALFLSPLKRHLSIGRDYLRLALDLSMLRGDLVQANYCLGLGPLYRICAGESLDAIRRDLPEHRSIVQRTGDRINAGYLSVCEQAIRALKGETSSLSSLDDAGFSETEFEHSARHSVFGVYEVIKLMVRFLGGDFHGALAAADAFEALPGTFYNVWHHFYRGLVLARLASMASGEERARLIDRMRDDMAFIAIRAKHAPVNHRHRDQLLRAELAVLEGDTLGAIRLYDAAVRGAREQGFIQDQALAYELASQALRVQGLETAADLYLGEARRAYRSWGADGKARQLQRSPTASGKVPLDETFVSSPEALDVSAIVKASQAISSELNWKSVSERLLELALEQCGGTNGCLLFKRDGSLHVAALAHVAGQAVSTRRVELTPVARMPVVPQSVVNYVSRSRELVVIDEPESNGAFTHDPYVRAHRPRCLLCLPILRQSEVAAVLYLENRLAAGVFTWARVRALELIAGQAAIALSNAELFEALEKENAERMRAEVYLRESRGLLQQIIDSTTALIAVKDPEGRILLSNRRFEEIISMPRDDLLGRTDYALSPPEEAESIRDHDRLVLEANRPLEFEERRELPDGVHTFLSLKFPLRDQAGLPTGVCVVATDITVRKRAEDELRESMAREREARTAAEEAVRLRDEFLSVASHELRTPLTSLQLAIYGLTRRLESENVDQLRKNLEVATRQVRRLGDLVGSLLDVSRIQAGRLAIERRVVDLGKLARETAAQLADELKQSGSTLTLQVADPILGYWDASRIEQILVNLLSNAIKFGEGKPIELTIEAREGGLVRITVTDYGIGVPLEVQRRLFERFGRGVSARHYGGLGLGLYIVRTIAEAHGGRAFATFGDATRFSVELPQALPKEKEEELQQ